MNKGQLIEVIAKEANITKTAANAALDAFIANTIKTVKGGDKVTLAGFGTFERRARKARLGINPATGESIKIKATKVPAFKAGKAFKEAVKK